MGRVLAALKKRSDVHAARKLWHMSTVSAMALVYAYTPSWVSVGLLVFVILLFIPLDFIRLKNPRVNDFVMKILGPFMRESERDRHAGTTYLLLGTAVIVAFFPREIVLLSLLFLAYADPIASYIGIKYGKDKIVGEKSLQGTLAAFFVCSLIAFLYFRIHEIAFERVILVSLIAGLIGALAELIPLWKIDDNFSIQIISAAGLYGVFLAFGVVG